MKKKSNIDELKKIALKEKKITEEINHLLESSETTSDPEEREMISSQIKSLKNLLKKTNNSIPKKVKELVLAKKLNPDKEEDLIEKGYVPSKELPQEIILKKSLSKESTNLSKLEKITLKRLKKKDKKIKRERLKKPSKYINLSNKLFSKWSLSVVKNKMFRTLEEDLTKSNLQFISVSYISVILFTTLLASIVGVFIFLFFLFFNLGAELPFITVVKENLLIRAGKIFWILFVVPLITLIFMFFYPSFEKKSTEVRINNELPFATIHMAAISGSMIDPSKIFRIIISTGEYPYLQKEFTKLINDINIYGYDLVTALRNGARNSSSKKLAELFNGLATTINSGGDLPEFFNKRSQSLLFEHRLEREKYTKFAETFMDIYISVVIAAPMILMLLLIMMKISGLGISLSTTAIAVIMVLGVSVINILFLTFLYLKQPSE